jgi:dCTP deaminase
MIEQILRRLVRELLPSVYPTYLGKEELLQAIAAGELCITPFVREQVAQSSIDLHLHPVLLKFESWDKVREQPGLLDMHQDPSSCFSTIVIPPEGYVLTPGFFYLGATLEDIFAPGLLGTFLGRSGVARMGISVEQAGFVEGGFEGRITTEMTVAAPVRVYGGSPIGQIKFSPMAPGAEDYRTRGTYSGRNRVASGPMCSRIFHTRARHQDAVSAIRKAALEAQKAA